MVGLVPVAEPSQDRDRVLDEGSRTRIGWKRRSSAASFSMCLRYSSTVVAPTTCSSPRASIGFSMSPAPIEPSAAPAPTTVWSSSMNSTTARSAAWTSSMTCLAAPRTHPGTCCPRPSRRGRGRRRACPSATRARRRSRCAARSPRRWRSCRPGVADQHRVVLRASREHLEGLLDLVIPSDDRVQEALPRRLREVPPVLVERRCGRVATGAARGAAAGSRPVPIARGADRVRIRKRPGQQPRGGGVRGVAESEQARGPPARSSTRRPAAPRDTPRARPAWPRG